MESEGQVVINVPDPETEDKCDMNASNPPADSARRQCYFHDNISKEAKKLETYVDGKISMLKRDYCGLISIYGVPKKHRNKNEDAYTPRIISIGPLHRGKIHLHAMEEHKLRYLTHFLKSSKFSLAQLAEYVHIWVKFVRYFYEDNYIRNQAKLSQVILLDGVFVVELFLRNYFPNMQEEGDMIFNNRWVSNDVLHDLLLLENQLPIIFLFSLYYRFVYNEVTNFIEDGTNNSDIPSFYELAHVYFKNVCNRRKLELGRNLQPPNFNELACETFDVRKPPEITWIMGVKPLKHLVEFLAIIHKPVSDRQTVENSKPEFTRCSTATELQAAGVKFQKGKEDGEQESSSGICIFDVHFKDGELSIPQLVINDFTETFFRNAIAFEQSELGPKNITSYVILLDNLIDTQKDVELLIKHGIIKNQLESSEKVADVFNNLYKEFVHDLDDFYFAKLCSELNDYSRDLWHKWNSKFTKWWAMLWRDYFGSPWSVISVVAALVLLILTVIQTVCSLLPFLR